MTVGKGSRTPAKAALVGFPNSANARADSIEMLNEDVAEVVIASSRWHPMRCHCERRAGRWLDVGFVDLSIDDDPPAGVRALLVETARCLDSHDWRRAKHAVGDCTVGLVRSGALISVAVWFELERVSGPRVWLWPLMEGDETVFELDPRASEYELTNLTVEFQEQVESLGFDDAKFADALAATLVT